MSNNAPLIPSHQSPNSFRILIAPLISFGGLLLFFFIKHSYPEQIPFTISIQLAQAITAILYLNGALLLNRLIDVVVWNTVNQARKHPVPKLLRDLTAAFIWLCGFCIVIIFVFDQSITAILTTSAVIMGVIGFTLKRFIMDAFAGIVIGLQHPFKEGDWIQFNDTWGIGRIIEINWRSVRLMTTDEIIYLITNSELIDNPIRIYSQPEPFFRDEIKITLPYNLTAHQAQRILLGAVSQIEDIAAIPRKSIVSIDDYTDRGIMWRLLYWCPSPGLIPTTRFKVHQNILRNLFIAGVQIPFPTQIFQHQATDETISRSMIGIDRLLARISLFSSFTNQELLYLSQHIQNKLFTADCPILCQGEPGDSLFILRDGLLSVRITDKNNIEREIDRIIPGQFFGERSLLLGDVRSATVTPIVDSTISEITKTTMSKLLTDRPELANYLSDILSKRQNYNANKMESFNNLDKEMNHSQSQKLLERIKVFFSLKE